MKKRQEAKKNSEAVVVTDKTTKHESIRVIAVTSGKGGVGKTNIAANLAYALSSLNQKTLILDADTGLANIDLILGLTPKYNLYHVLSGQKTMAEIIIKGPGGIMILPSSSGIADMADLSKGHKLTIIDELNRLKDRPDFMLIDTAAGIAANVMYFNMAAKEIIIVTTPEPPSLTDAYALMKILHKNYAKKRFQLIVNMVRTPAEAKEVYGRLRTVTDHFLNIHLEYLGFVLYDDKCQEAVRQQKALMELYPSSVGSRCLRQIAEKLLKETPDVQEEGSVVFFGDSVIGQDHE
jgi:flagellar biosynthesis protein FlhG